MEINFVRKLLKPVLKNDLLLGLLFFFIFEIILLYCWPFDPENLLIFLTLPRHW